MPARGGALRRLPPASAPPGCRFATGGGAIVLFALLGSARSRTPCAARWPCSAPTSSGLVPPGRGARVGDAGRARARGPRRAAARPRRRRSPGPAPRPAPAPRGSSSPGADVPGRQLAARRRHRCSSSCSRRVRRARSPAGRRRVLYLVLLGHRPALRRAPARRRPAARLGHATGPHLPRLRRRPAGRRARHRGDDRARRCSPPATPASPVVSAASTRSSTSDWAAARCSPWPSRSGSRSSLPSSSSGCEATSGTLAPPTCSRTRPPGQRRPAAPRDLLAAAAVGARGHAGVPGRPAATGLWWEHDPRLAASAPPVRLGDGLRRDDARPPLTPADTRAARHPVG